MESGHAWTGARARLVRNLLGEYGGRDPLVLDAGCGTGAFAASLAATGVRVVAVDAEVPSEITAAVQYARARLTALPFAEAAFDVALMLDVLEHLDAEKPALVEIARVLRPGGTLIATVPALEALWGPRDELAGHARRYELDSLRDAIESAGFEVDRIGFWAATTLPLLRVSRAVARVRPGTLGAEERPPRLVNAVLRPVLRADVERALGPGWRTGSSLFAVARTPS